MADKRPIVLYSGNLKEIATGDTVPLANGGTGATTAAAARAALELPNMFGRRNRIGNGGIALAQRAFSGTGYIADRWSVYQLGSFGCTFSRDTNAAPGFVISAKATITAAAALGATDQITVFTAIEGLDLRDFALGTASAILFSLSFWVRASVPGTYAASLRNGSANRSYVVPVVVNAANTWELKSFLIPGDTGGTWATDTGIGMYVAFNAATGSTYSTATPNTWLTGNYVGLTGQTQLSSTNGSTFQLTGVQVERGNATPYEFRDFPVELLLAQRYCEAGLSGLAGYSQPSISNSYRHAFKVTKRVVPTLTFSSASSNNLSAADVRNPSTDGFENWCTVVNSGPYVWFANWTASADMI